MNTNDLTVEHCPSKLEDGYVRLGSKKKLKEEISPSNGVSTRNKSYIWDDR